ncbi:hypothetical protein DPMN_128070 [Dreissena polymorpha]|uniref:Uncharacterized protein n=1 Tax=Dreissena polymorpha TaxID=45954 RepID=A0A9D4JX25_DREPO|nr:hypothetical protein DPMN_128070 [Dreissena polymorpha]
MWAGRLNFGNGAMHMIRLKGNAGWVRPMWAVPWVRVVIRDIQRGAPGLIIGPCIVEIDRFVIRDIKYQFQVNRCRNAEVNFQGSMSRSDGQTAAINTISPRF